MSKLTINLVMTLLLVGCMTIEKAIVDKITLPNGGSGYSVDCGMYGWSGCFVEAGNRCTNGYVVHERTMSEDIESKIPVEEMKDIKSLSAVPIRPPDEGGKYMIISCR